MALSSSFACFIVCALLCFCSSPVNAFLSSASCLTSNNKNKNNAISLRPPSKPLFLSEDLPLLGEGSDTLADGDSQSLLRSLRQRQDALEKGIGKRYRCHTQKGFLNVHMEPGDPFNKDNIVSQLKEGEIVTSTAPARGPWIKHDKGGWSVSVYAGHIWLEELKE